MIDGVIITPLKQILDERGKVMHMLKNSDPHFSTFGEIYFSCIYPDAIKAWHIHSKMTLNYAVPHGKIKFVLYDNREKSPTRGEIQEIFIGPDNYVLVTVPPWSGTVSKEWVPSFRWSQTVHQSHTTQMKLIGSTQCRVTFHMTGR